MVVADLYDEDLEGWAEAQVEALRRFAEKPGPMANAVDWENVIEEIDSLGREERSAVESLLAQAIVHIIKIWADPKSLSDRAWRKEVDTSLSSARRKFRPAMRQRIDFDTLWRSAVNDAGDVLHAFKRPLPANMPKSAPFTMSSLLDPDFQIEAALKALGQNCHEHQ